jgi:hypothetical protein
VDWLGPQSVYNHRFRGNNHGYPTQQQNFGYSVDSTFVFERNLEHHNGAQQVPFTQGGVYQYQDIIDDRAKYPACPHGMAMDGTSMEVAWPGAYQP